MVNHLQIVKTLHFKSHFNLQAITLTLTDSRVPQSIVRDRQLVATFTIPAGTPSGSDIPFMGISVNNDGMMNGEEQFRLVITGLPFSQILGDGIFGFVDVTIDDDDDGKLYSYTCQNITILS